MQLQRLCAGHPELSVGGAKKLGIELTTSRDRLTPTPGSTGEKKIPSELNEVADEASRKVKYLQEQILLSDRQIAQICSFVITMEALVKWAAGERSAQSSGGGISCQPKNAEEYKRC